MSKTGKKLLSWLLAAGMTISLLSTAALAADSGLSAALYDANGNPLQSNTISASGETQQVKMTITADEEFSAYYIGFTAQVPEGWKILSFENSDDEVEFLSYTEGGDDYTAGKEKESIVSWVNPAVANVTTSEIGSFVVEVPADVTPGTYTLTANEILAGYFDSDYDLIYVFDAEQISLDLTIKDNAVASTGIALSQETAALTVGGASLTLTTALQPADTTDAITSTTWASSNEAVATVADGVVTAVAAGSADITATVVTAGGKTWTASCAVTVSAPVPATDYTVTIAPAGATDNVRVGDTVTMNVTVTGADFNGVEAVVTYNKAIFSYGEDTTGTIKISKLFEGAQSGTVVETLTFKAIAAGTGAFGFESATVDDYLGGISRNSVSATTVGASVTVKAVYPVTIGAIANGSASADKSTAVEGEDVTITVTPDEGYQLDALTVTDANGKPVSVTKNADGTYTFAMPAGSVTVSPVIVEEPTIDVNTYENYVTGYTLVTVSGGDAAYTYDGNAMYYIEVSGVHAWLVAGAADETKVAVGTATAGTIAASSAGIYDVNNTGKVDFNDAICAFGCFNVAYDVEANMTTYLRADVDGSHNVDADDVNDILKAY